MANNKEIIIRIILGIIFFLIVARILIPVFLDMLKGKSFGLSKDSNDLDYLIKKQKEVLKSQYKIQTQQPHVSNSQLPTPSADIQKIKTEISWGGNQLQLDLKNKILKDFSYGFSDSKVAAFINLIEKRNYLNYIEQSEKVDYQTIINYLIVLFIFFVLIDEVKNRDLNFTAKCSKKLNISPEVFALAIQLKVLLSIKDSPPKDERIFVENFVLHQYSEETLKKSIEYIIKTEANLWSKSISSFFEELSLYLNYAQILNPVKRPINKKDLDSALNIFNATSLDQIDEIKKSYKKMALQFHPDKIVPLKLPRPLEKKAIDKFNIIQESFEIISERIKQ